MLHRAAAFASVVLGGIYAYCMGKWWFDWARDAASNKNKQKRLSRSTANRPATGRAHGERRAGGRQGGRRWEQRGRLFENDDRQQLWTTPTLTNERVVATRDSHCSMLTFSSVTFHPPHKFKEHVFVFSLSLQSYILY